MIGVAEFYAGKSIFVTGGTGFIGKVLIEKLLRSCPEIKAIYMMVRPKKGLSCEQRCEILFNEKLYDRLRSEQPAFTDKVHFVTGDILHEGLGISDDHRHTLEREVNVVFHSAATIRFNEPLKLAIQLNMLGVRRMLVLCKQFQNLNVFLHVSTAYANCERKFIDEVIYPPSISPQKIIDSIEWMDDETVALITPKIIGDKPNTYTFTKQLAETMLVTEGCDLPIAIVRPSIVTASWQEPLPGWIDNINGPSGLYIAAGKGLLRSIKADAHVIADLIPVDLPVNMMITAAWYTAVSTPQPTTPPFATPPTAKGDQAAPAPTRQLPPVKIYHSTTGGLNPFTWGEMEGVIMRSIKRNPFESCFRRPKCTLTKHDFMHDYWVLVCHMIPAHIVDLGYRLMGRKPKMVNIYSKIHKALNTLEYFTVREWEWTHNNMEMLKNQLSPEDQKKFLFDPRGMHWPTYLDNYLNGTKKFVLKEDESGLPAARAHIKRLRNIRYVFNTCILMLVWRLMVARSQMARNSWTFMMALVAKFVKFFRITSTRS